MASNTTGRVEALGVYDSIASAMPPIEQALLPYIDLLCRLTQDELAAVAFTLIPLASLILSLLKRLTSCICRFRRPAGARVVDADAAPSGGPGRGVWNTLHRF